MSLLLLPLPGAEARASSLGRLLDAGPATAEFRRFPDGESYARLDTDATGRVVVVVGSLDGPDSKIASLLFAAAAARARGAAKVVLAAPYLAYMRQDASFRPGEAVTARVFARLLSAAFDAVVAVDPHLHRLHALEEVYDVPTVAVSCAPAIVEHVRRTVAEPVLVGPDAESGRWVGAVAEALGAPSLVFEKTRRGDRDVLIGGAEGASIWRDRTPVLVDDIISTGRTMIGAARVLADAGFRPAVCVGIHAVLVPGAYEELLRAPIARVVTSDTIAHPSNAIPVDALLADGIRRAVARLG